MLARDFKILRKRIIKIHGYNRYTIVREWSIQVLSEYCHLACTFHVKLIHKVNPIIESSFPKVHLILLFREALAFGITMITQFSLKNWVKERFCKNSKNTHEGRKPYRPKANLNKDEPHKKVYFKRIYFFKSVSLNTRQ